MINILTYVSKRRSEASVSFVPKSLEMDHFRCSVAPQIPMFSLCCIFSISIGTLHVILYKNIYTFRCAATAATNPRVTIRIDGKSEASAQTRTRASLRPRPLAQALSCIIALSWVAFGLLPFRLLFWFLSQSCSQPGSPATFGPPVRSSGPQMASSAPWEGSSSEVEACACQCGGFGILVVSFHFWCDLIHVITYATLGPS